MVELRNNNYYNNAAKQSNDTDFNYFNLFYYIPASIYLSFHMFNLIEQ